MPAVPNLLGEWAGGFGLGAAARIATLFLGLAVIGPVEINFLPFAVRALDVLRAITRLGINNVRRLIGKVFGVVLGMRRRHGLLQCRLVQHLLGLLLFLLR